MKEIFENVFEHQGRILTPNRAPGSQVYGENLMQIGGKEYRAWNPNRSKLCAAIKNGLRNNPIKYNSAILYLGASTGTTPSHLSDILVDGGIYAVEVSAHSMKTLLRLCEKRDNIIPILADARQPQSYHEVGEVDIIYEDVASPEQADILLKNSRMFLKKGGHAMIAIKSQSIDVTKKPEETYTQVKEELSKELELVEEINLEPYEKDHLFLVLKKK
ncbi:fibrillarin-like rRNA/tRNA 2'-O-methyltransferase [Candidatus Micrarchaeota archaeon]|nr:fibrillarin-like rRNA/tRNA 2'-O-methyltransferase [Candidatus Micrarchaeota archaeon]MBD3417718.1 fibrillarin-like rRNA/tRNA 2'-O-methyltransferase [Candidatus Micrarchaeota archaeon]